MTVWEQRTSRVFFDAASSMLLLANKFLPCDCHTLHEFLLQSSCTQYRVHTNMSIQQSALEIPPA